MERTKCTSWTQKFLNDSFFLTLEAADDIAAEIHLNAAESTLMRQRLEQLRVSLTREWLVLFLENRLTEGRLAGERRRN